MGNSVNADGRHAADADADADTAGGDSAADDSVMGALRSHVPLTLLMDLTNPQGPDSIEISEAEGGDADWLPEHEAGETTDTDDDGSGPTNS